MDWSSLLNTELTNKEIRKLMLNYTKLEDVFINFNNIEKEVKYKLEKIKEYNISDDIRILSYNDDEYPQLLKCIKDFPPFLFVKGNKLENYNYIAVVGTRNYTKLGEKTCRKIVSGFSEYDNISIVSGMARGIDSISHIEAIKNKIHTVAVLATNIYECYPKENIKLKEKIIEKGTVITEVRPNEQLKKHHFVMRNRIVAALSRAVCVIESPKSSGSMITAKYANIYDREVYATPSNIFDKNFEACNDLIMKNKAKLIMSADDIAYEYSWRKNEKVFSDS